MSRLCTTTTKILAIQPILRGPFSHGLPGDWNYCWPRRSGRSWPSANVGLCGCPRAWGLGAGLIVASMAVWLALRKSAWGLVVGLALAAPAVGFTAAQIRTHVVSAPVIERELGPAQVQGRVVVAEVRPSDRRLTLDDLTIGGSLAPLGHAAPGSGDGPRPWGRSGPLRYRHLARGVVTAVVSCGARSV